MTAALASSYMSPNSSVIIVPIKTLAFGHIPFFTVFNAFLCMFHL